MTDHADTADQATRIGQLLCQGGWLTQDQLDQALEEQADRQALGTSSPLGEICARHGWCTMGDVAAAVRQQQDAAFRDTTLGHLLVTQDQLTLVQLDEALAAQEEVHAPLGQVLVAKGFCTPEQVQAAIALQTRRRNSALRHLTAAAFNTFNVTEIIVNQELDEIRRDEGACSCDECRANALALALNSLPPRYVSDHRLLLLFVDRFRAESLDLIRDRIRVAVQRVREHPNHTRYAQPPPPHARAGHPLPARRIERHVHLSQHDVERLFGPGYKLHPWQPTSQPGYFAARETVEIVGPQDTLRHVRVIGPPLRHTRVEAIGSDFYQLGQGADNPVTLRGPHGTVDTKGGVMRIGEHLHVSDDEASALGLREGQAVRVRVRGERPRVFEAVPVRIAGGHALELHLPADEPAVEGPSDVVPAELLLEGDPTT